MDKLFIDEKGRIFKKTKKGMEKLSIFTDRYFSLRTFAGIPILEIDGIRMHLIKNFSDPLEYSTEVCLKLKIREGNSVLDTCGGLGYTAIEASKKATKVVSIEKNKEVIELAKQNPYSNEYFNSKKIEIINADSFEKIKEFENNSFDKIIHDPPRISLAPYLYTLEFYRELNRILKPKGVLYHYIGFVGRGRGIKIEERIKEKLMEAGFKKLRYDPKCYGWFGSKE
ncbi:MAG: RsmD family RNA methyltransferase [Candidatus Micrarchaeia archaeon]